MAELRRLFAMKSRIVVSFPQSLTRALGWRARDYVDFELLSNGRVIVRRVDIPRPSDPPPAAAKRRG